MFWVNLPIAVIAIVLGIFFVPESKDPTAPKLDPLGAGLSIVGLGALLFAIIEGPTEGWGSATVLAAFVVGIVGIAAFVLWERHTDHPMLDMSFFKNPRFTAANLAITLTFFAMFGSMFLMTQYWQFVHGYTPLQAGVRLIPFALSMMITAPLSARLVERVGTKMVVTIGLLIVTVGAAAAVVHQGRHELPRGDLDDVPDGRRHGPDDGPGHRERDGLAATREGRCRLGGERHHPPDGRRHRRGDHRHHRGQRVLLGRSVPSPPSSG